MGWTSLLLGIAAVLLALNPYFWFVGGLFACVGFVLGWTEVVQRKRTQRPITRGVLGSGVNALAVIVILAYMMLLPLK